MDRRYASLVLLLHPNRGRPRTLYIRRTLFYILAVALVVGIPGSMWGAFELGQVWRVRNIEQLKARAGNLESTKEDLQEQIAGLRNRIGGLQSSKAIQSGELGKLRQLLDQLEGRIDK
ncbi:MAG TPA: hypothetical protein VKA48_12970, partial [Gammaproteobacteria bacterium]|nr:hypothetical protein [Gammaproteobacteria bacterium]